MAMEIDKLVKFCDTFCTLAEGFLEKTAKEKKKLDPKAKVRNRGNVVFPASSCKDKKDHFPINNEAQARNALARSHQYSKVPSWYSGSLSSLQEAVRRKVHSKYPGIESSKEKSKKSFLLDELLEKYGEALGISFDDDAENFVEKFAQQTPMGASNGLPPANPADLQAKMNTALQPFGYVIRMEPRVLNMEKEVVVDANPLPHAKWQGTGRGASEISKLLTPLVPGYRVTSTISS